MDGPDVAKIESSLRESLESAKAAYELTKKRFELALNSRTECGAERVNGTPSLKEITQDHSTAMENYRTALIEFNRFILSKGTTLGQEPRIATTIKDGQSRRAKPEPKSLGSDQ